MLLKLLAIKEFLILYKCWLCRATYEEVNKCECVCKWMWFKIA